MKVFKFGGGVIRDAAAVAQLSHIIQQESPAVVVISAMDKTTRVLENLLQERIDGIPYETTLQALYTFHQDIIDQLLVERRQLASQMLKEQLIELEQVLIRPYTLEAHDRLYSEVVAWGELTASKIIFHYLCEQQQPCHWIDARECIKTQGHLCHASVDWPTTQAAIHHTLDPVIAKGAIALTQGFIGSQGEHTTTLGREGSDYTAAILAATLGATSVTFWKDVVGVMSADPKQYAQAYQFSALSYQDMATMAFYGAKVVHPRTLQPLSEHSIPLHIRPFHHPQEPGTTITHQAPPVDRSIYILKVDQCLLHIGLQGLQFFEESHMQEVLQALVKHDLQVHFLCRDTYSLSVCVPKTLHQVQEILEELAEKYIITHHTPTSLFTVLYPTDEEIIPAWVENGVVLLTQRRQGIFQAVLEGTIP